MSKNSREYLLSKAMIKNFNGLTVVSVDDASNIMEEYSDENSYDLMDLLFSVKNRIEDGDVISTNTQLFKDIQKIFQ